MLRPSTPRRGALSFSDDPANPRKSADIGQQAKAAAAAAAAVSAAGGGAGLGGGGRADDYDSMHGSAATSGSCVDEEGSTLEGRPELSGSRGLRCSDGDGFNEASATPVAAAQARIVSE